MALVDSVKDTYGNDSLPVQGGLAQPLAKIHRTCVPLTDSVRVALSCQTIIYGSDGTETRRKIAR